LITDGRNPINLFSAANGMINPAAVTNGNGS
jgi:hypothetical protein